MRLLLMPRHRRPASAECALIGCVNEAAANTVVDVEGDEMARQRVISGDDSEEDGQRIERPIPTGEDDMDMARSFYGFSSFKQALHSLLYR